jgi:hypothetical protein
VNQSRVSIGEILAATAGFVLILSTFLPWFQRETLGGLSGRTTGQLGDHNAWQASVVLALLLVLVAAVPIWQALSRARDDRPARPMFAVAAGAIAVTLVLGGAATKLGNSNGGGIRDSVISTTAGAGLLVAALAALLIAVGGVAAMWGLRPAGRSPGDR